MLILQIVEVNHSFATEKQPKHKDGGVDRERVKGEGVQDDDVRRRHAAGDDGTGN